MKTVELNSAAQQEAYNKFSKLKCGAIFSSPGTGKTKVALDLAALKKEQGKIDYVLYIAPASLIAKGDPEEERKKWHAELTVDYVTCEGIGASDKIYLDTVEKIKTHKTFCIVDESLKIKNVSAKRTKRIIEIGPLCAYRIILNGTPLTKNIMDIWSQMEFLSPLILKLTYRQYKDTFCEYYLRGKYKGRIIRQANIPYLISIISPYIYQAELDIEAAKQYEAEYYYINQTEYDEYKESLFDEYYNSDLGELNFKAFSTKLQKWYSNSPEHERAVQKVIDKVAGQCIVFVKYLSNIPPGAVAYTGEKTIQERRKILQDFKAKKFNVLYMTYGCGSFGLNLQYCKTIIFADHTWDYAQRLQAEGRIYRMDITEDVTYYDIICDNSGLENIIIQNLGKKKSKLVEVKEEITKAKGDKEKVKEILKKL